MPDRPLAAVLTLGCKLNLADSESIARDLRSAGFDVVDRLCDADAFVVNTCSVTHVADRKSRRLIRSARRMSPVAPIAVTGCYPRSAVDPIEALGADLVVGMSDRARAELVAFLAGRAQPGVAALPPCGPTRLHTRAFVKAQEGCNDVCAFCIVPRLRGQERSLSIAAVVAEVDAAFAEGAREAVITGTQLGAWGRDLDPAMRPHQLIGGILEATEIPRIRFSSLQPQDITPELLALWQDPRLMPHFHLALQSGSESVLRRMRRRYTAGDYLRAVERIYAAVPGAAITTDVIAGFPGESEAEFEQTLALCREARFSALHSFPYSPRRRTSAAVMPGHVGRPLLDQRMARLLALGEVLSLDFRRAAAGTSHAVLWEVEQEIGADRWWKGHADTYVVVYGRGKDLRHRITPVRMGPVYHDGVQAMPPCDAAAAAGAVAQGADHATGTEAKWHGEMHG